MSHIQIAIDGPSGSGKSSLSRRVAAKMGIVYVDTGALYRTIGYYARGCGISLAEIEKVVGVLDDIHIEVKFENGGQSVYLNGENLGDKIRENEISMYASAVAKVPAVRAFLLDVQKDIANTNSVIMDGRDIGTVILPNADVKIFMSASIEARARRRCVELEEKGMPASYEEILSDMIARDKQDSEREIAPAVAAPDAIHFDNSERGFEESLEALIKLIEDTLASKNISL